METIHTLGPTTTDSYAAACHIPGRKAAKIQLHPSFDELLAELGTYPGDELLIPAAYQSQQPDFGWRELCYEYSQQLKLVTVFSRPLQPMVVIENPRYTEDAAVIHPACENLLRHTLGGGDYQIAYAGSKTAAFAEYRRVGYRYTIVSAGMVDEDSVALATFAPEMVWCLYQIQD